MRRLVLLPLLLPLLLAFAGCAGGQNLVTTACTIYKLQEAPAKTIAGLVPVPGVSTGVTAGQAVADAACAAAAKQAAK